MRKKDAVGKHRKITSAQTAKGRVAFVAAAAGAVSTAGIGGATAAQITETPSSDIALANDAAALSSNAAPQILAISEFKPAVGLDQQLATAVASNNERMAADAAARAPKAVKPAEGTFTSGYGARWGTVHKGIDIANAEGTPILSVLDGVVIDAGPASGFGQWVRVQHEDGTVTVYGHISTIDVTVGQTVTAGQKIAGMGNLGFSTGTHLHFEVHPAGGDAIDPLPWLAERGITV